MPCLAITAVVTLHGLDRSAGLEPAAGNTNGSAAPARNNLGSSSSTGPGAVGGSAQPEALRNGLNPPSLAGRLNSLLSTPLAASLFHMLGVDKRRVAMLAQSGGTTSLEQFSALHDIYCEVLTYQVGVPQCRMQGR